MVRYVAGRPQAFWDVPTSKTMELRTGPIEENKASTMGLRLFDFLSNRTARSTRMARIALTAGILAPEEAIIPMPTMQVSKIRQASMKNRKKACATKLTASSTAKSA